MTLIDAGAARTCLHSSNITPLLNLAANFKTVYVKRYLFCVIRRNILVNWILTVNPHVCVFRKIMLLEVKSMGYPSICVIWLILNSGPNLTPCPLISQQQLYLITFNITFVWRMHTFSPENDFRTGIYICELMRRRRVYNHRTQVSYVTAKYIHN